MYLYILFLTLLEVICLCIGYETTRTINKEELDSSSDWDYILFSQRWPITSCVHWEEEKNDNTCSMPNYDSWIIHGLWPTKTGTDGPCFCPSAIHFDPQQLQPVLSDLQKYWTNIENNTKPDSFWAHEWNKHGTCAIVDPELNSVINYFVTGLNLYKQFNIMQALNKNNIVPSNVNNYNIDDINIAIKTYFGKDPMIQCITDKKTKETMISEIRLCLDRNLNIIDCDDTNPVHNGNGTITNCSTKKPIKYLSTLPSGAAYEMDYIEDALMDFWQQYESLESYKNIYRFLKFIMWFTI